MNRIIVIFMVLCSVVHISWAQIQSWSIIDTYNINRLDSLVLALGIDPFFIDPEYELKVYKISYLTPGPDGNLYTATGALVVPENYSCPLPLAAYCHGTVHHATGVPSYFSDELTIGVLFASVGNVLVLPDYLGLGDSNFPYHPYVHTNSQALTTVNALRSARMLADSLSYGLNDQIFLFGYSQGGHAAMATHKMIEEDFPNEFQVTASAPMSGPYDISGAQSEVITSNTPYPTPGYLPYVALAYNEIYGLFNDPSEIFVPPYDQTLPPLFFDPAVTMGEFNQACPSIPNQILQPQVLSDFQSDPDHFFRVALRDNDVHDWTPDAPVHMFYCTGDDQVGFQNTINAYNNFMENGATQIQKTDFGNFDHGGCVEIALLGAKLYFDSYKDLSNGISINYQIFPESTPGAMDASIEVSASGGAGNYEFFWSNGLSGTLASGLSNGQSIELTVVDDLGCQKVINLVVDPATSVLSFESRRLSVFPNPAQIFMQVNLPADNAGKTLRMNSPNGKLLRSWKLSGEQQLQINRAGLPAGLYFLNMVSENVVYQSKIVWF